MCTRVVKKSSSRVAASPIHHRLSVSLRQDLLGVARGRVRARLRGTVTFPLGRSLGCDARQPYKRAAAAAAGPRCLVHAPPRPESGCERRPTFRACRNSMHIACFAPALSGRARVLLLRVVSRPGLLYIHVAAMHSRTHAHSDVSPDWARLGATGSVFCCLQQHAPPKVGIASRSCEAPLLVFAAARTVCSACVCVRSVSTRIQLSLCVLRPAMTRPPHVLAASCSLLPVRVLTSTSGKSVVRPRNGSVASNLGPRNELRRGASCCGPQR